MDPILVSGVKLMMIGMSAVFFFLTLLVVCTKIMSAVIQRFFSGSQNMSVNHPARPGAVRPETAETDSEVIAAIGVAVDRFRRDRMQ